MLLSRVRPSLAAPRAGPYPAAWLAVALALGLLLARLPLPYGLALLAGAALAAAAAWEPVVGLGLAMVLGPTRAYLSVTFPALPTDMGQLFFALAVAGWVARGLATRRIVIRRLPLLVPLAVYAGVGLVSLLGAVSLEEGLKEVLKWAEVLVAIIILVDEAERGRAPVLLGFIVAAGLAQAGLAIWQNEFRGTGPEHFRLADGSYRAYGTFEQPNPLGGFLGILWPVAAGLALAALAPLATYLLYRLWRWRSRSRSMGRARPAWRADGIRVLTFGGAAAAMLAGLFVSYSRGAWLGAAAAVAVMTIALPRRIWFGLALMSAGLALTGALSVAGLLPASVTARIGDLTDFTRVEDVRGVEIEAVNFAIVERLAHWQAAAAMARDYPWLGVGLGNYGPVYPRYSLVNWPNALGHAHMIYLNVLAETGIAGLAAYLLLWGSVVALTLRVIQRSGGLARGLALGLLGAWAHLSVHQLVDNLYVNNIHFVLAGLLSLLVFLARRRGTPRAGFFNL